MMSKALFILLLTTVASQSDFFKRLLDHNEEMERLDRIIAEREDYYDAEEEEEKETGLLDPRIIRGRDQREGPTIEECLFRYPTVCNLPDPVEEEDFEDGLLTFKRLKEESEEETTTTTTTTTITPATSAASGPKRPFYNRQIFRIFY